MAVNAPVLLINSYAGSLNIAAHQVKAKVIGSYEDAGYGLEAQELNYPQVDYRWTTSEWPLKADLRDVTVLAHPPCSIFSGLHNTTSAKGCDAENFQPHRTVMDYALGHRCRALAIESVPGALTALAEYQAYASRYRYRLYVVRVNAFTFGVPQWRPRVWFLFTKQERLTAYYVPQVRPLISIFRRAGTLDHGLGFLDKTIAALSEVTGEDPPTITRRVFNGEVIGKMFKGVEHIYGTAIYEKWREKLGGAFSSSFPRVVNPERWSVVLLGNSIFFMLGRLLYVEEYENLMGFPPNWRWPKTMYRDYKRYLSKGVCPPVAVWILRVLGAASQEGAVNHTFYPDGYVNDLTINTGQALDLLNAHRQMKLF